MDLRCACPPFAVNLRNLACIGSVACTLIASAQVNVTAPKQSAYGANARTYYVELKKTLNAEKLKPGDPVEFSLIEATLLSGRVVAPAHATLQGKVVQVQPADRKTQQQSLLSIIVDSIHWKNASVPVCASIAGFGTREFKFTGDQWPMRPSTIPLQQQSRAEQIAATASVAQFQTNSGVSVQPNGSDLFSEPEVNVVSTGDGFVKDLVIFRSPTSASVLERKAKNIKLPSGTLVALEELSKGADGCGTTVPQ